VVDAYITVIFLTHLGVAAVLFFFYRQEQSRFAWAFSAGWLLEGVRAAMILLLHQTGSPHWAEIVQELLYLPVTILLVYSITEWAGTRLSRGLVVSYLVLSTIGFLLVDQVLAPQWIVEYGTNQGFFYRRLALDTVIFLPGGLARVWLSFSFFRIWKRLLLPGAFIGGIFSLPHAVGSLTVPLETYMRSEVVSSWSALFWFVQILGLSIGAILLVLNKQHADLEAALVNVKKLSGLLPICSSCKKVRDDQGYWDEIESYLLDHSEATFSHGLCPSCAAKLYPELEDQRVSSSLR
jgi:hypothetical protein